MQLINVPLACALYISPFSVLRRLRICPERSILLLRATAKSYGEKRSMHQTVIKIKKKMLSSWLETKIVNVQKRVSKNVFQLKRLIARSIVVSRIEISFSATRSLETCCALRRFAPNSKTLFRAFNFYFSSRKNRFLLGRGTIAERHSVRIGVAEGWLEGDEEPAEGEDPVRRSRVSCQYV